ncbi:hypothetical protein Tco_0887765 [Tanacetum coccineum]
MLVWILGPKSVKRASVLHQLDGVGSQRHHIVPIGELNGVSIALVARQDSRVVIVLQGNRLRRLEQNLTEVYRLKR